MTNGRTYLYDDSKRVAFGDDDVRVYAWPSRGGVIVLDEAEAIDLEFLGLDPLDPPAERDANQEAEDAFSQRLLLLGAKWWDSEARYVLVCGVQSATYGYQGITIESPEKSAARPRPTMREKRWVKVGWPSSGGLWVFEFDTTWARVEEAESLPPEERLGRVKMARSMDERCQLLRDVFRAKFFSDVTQYDGHAFLQAWAWKNTGEAGCSLLTPEETYLEWLDSK